MQFNRAEQKYLVISQETLLNSRNQEVLSPILFTVYLDELPDRQEKSKVGCHAPSSFWW